MFASKLRYAFAALLALAQCTQPAFAGTADRPVVYKGGQSRPLPNGDAIQANPEGIVLSPSSGTPDGAVNGQCWTEATGAFCQIAGTKKELTNPAGGSGTVTSVSVTTANGVSGSVATATSTPAITLTLGAITPSSIVASGTVAGSNLSGTNTGDQTSVSGNAGTATALATGRAFSITGKATASGCTFDGSAACALNVTAVTLVAGDIPNIAESQVTSLTSDLAAKQASDTELTALAGLTSAADKFPYFTGSGTAATVSCGSSCRSAFATLAGSNTGDQDLSSYATTSAVAAAYQPLDSDLTNIAALTTTAFGRGLLDDADAAAGRTSLGLGSAATSASSAFQAADVDLDTFAAITPSANVQTLLGAANYAAFRSSLGVTATGADSAYQAADADLTTYAGITPSANVQTLLGAASYSAFRTSLSLVPGTDVEAHDADLTAIAALAGTSGFLTKTAANTWALDTSTYLTGNQTVTLSGDVTGTGATSISTTVGKINGTSLAGLATGILKNTTGTGVPSIAVAGDFPTLNQSTSGSAATLTTPRAIYGNNFDGSAALTQIIASTYGGTGNGFTKFTGPATAERTFTLPNADATLLYSGGALGTPSSGTLTNATGLPIAGLTASTSTSLGVGSVELGHATDTTIARASAGQITVEGVAVLLSGGAAGTPASLTLTNATGLPIAGLTASTSTALGVGSIELGAASDTTFARVSAGVVSVEGKTLATLDNPVFTNVMYWQQASPTAVNATGTLTIANLLGGIITTTSSTAVSLTLPTGTLSDAGILSGALANDRMFDWYTINLGSSSGAITLVAGTGHTIVGSATCAISVTCHWGTRKTATNTFVTYRLG